jgi:hypothetical protein
MAFFLNEEYLSSSAKGGVPAKISSQHPANRMIRCSEMLLVFIRLHGVICCCFHTKLACILVPVERWDLDAGDALYGQEFRSRLESFLLVVPVEYAFHGSGIRMTPEIAESCEEPPGLVLAEGFHLKMKSFSSYRFQAKYYKIMILKGLEAFLGIGTILALYKD